MPAAGPRHWPAPKLSPTPRPSAGGARLRTPERGRGRWKRQPRARAGAGRRCPARLASPRSRRRRGRNSGNYVKFKLGEGRGRREWAAGSGAMPGGPPAQPDPAAPPSPGPVPGPARGGGRRGCPEPRPHLRRLRSHRPALTASRPAEPRRRSSSSSSAGSRRDLLLPLQRAQSLLASTGLPLPPFTPASPHLSAQRGAPSSRFPCPGAAQPRSAPRRRLQKPPGASPFKWTRSIPPLPTAHTHTHTHTYMHTHTQTHTLLLFSLPFFLSRFAHFLQSEFILQTLSLHNCPPTPRTQTPLSSPPATNKSGGTRKCTETVRHKARNLPAPQPAAKVKVHLSSPPKKSIVLPF